MECKETTGQSQARYAELPPAKARAQPKGEEAQQNFDSKPTEGSSASPERSRPSSRAAPTDSPTPTPKFQEAGRQSLKAGTR